MSIMHLSICGLPFSINGIAGIDLMVSVTDQDGAPYTSLQKANFDVRWILEGAAEQPLQALDVTEYRTSNKLPALPGVYDVSLRSQSAVWTATSAGISVFYVAVKEDNNHGQALYTIEDATCLAALIK